MMEEPKTCGIHRKTVPETWYSVGGTHLVIENEMSNNKRVEKE